MLLLATVLLAVLTLLLSRLIVLVVRSLLLLLLLGGLLLPPDIVVLLLRLLGRRHLLLLWHLLLLGRWCRHLGIGLRGGLLLRARGCASLLGDDGGRGNVPGNEGVRLHGRGTDRARAKDERQWTHSLASITLGTG